ncbi:hypothetical protein ILUMI_24420 [Ignelater luminosus]|uniref:Uncharacterized protein n=1 Tax=Ignelater luminosus TaxID=2038154 RepID=A0A8K0FYS1_IGNLU|nr:hypothetical protein ILUMI_24420 [Ignelater luminosus]
MEKIESMFGEITHRLQQMDAKFEQLMKDVSNNKEDNELMKEKIIQEMRIKNLERELRRKNLVIKGVEDVINENNEETKAKSYWRRRTESKKKGQGYKELEQGHVFIYSGVREQERASADVGCLIHNATGRL